MSAKQEDNIYLSLSLTPFLSSSFLPSLPPSLLFSLLFFPLLPPLLLLLSRRPPATPFSWRHASCSDVHLSLVLKVGKLFIISFFPLFFYPFSFICRTSALFRFLFPLIVALLSLLLSLFFYNYYHYNFYFHIHYGFHPHCICTSFL